MSTSDQWDYFEERLAIAFADVLAASGVTDAKFGSMTVHPEADGFGVYVVSESQGHTRIGLLPHEVIQRGYGDAADRYIADLEAKQAPPEGTRRRRGRPAWQPAEFHAAYRAAAARLRDRGEAVTDDAIGRAFGEIGRVPIEARQVRRLIAQHGVPRSE